MAYVERLNAEFTRKIRKVLNTDELHKHKARDLYKHFEALYEEFYADSFFCNAAVSTAAMARLLTACGEDVDEAEALMRFTFDNALRFGIEAMHVKIFASPNFLSQIQDAYDKQRTRR